MLMMPKKKIAVSIVGSLPGKASDMMGTHDPKVHEVGSHEDDVGIGLEAAASSLASALEAKDYKRVATSLRDFVELCSYMKPDEDEVSD